MNPPILWYFADPMCSWCWGFSPVIETLRDEYRERMKIALVLGGLRPGETAPMTAAGREEILHHWHQVHERTGQAFRFEDALPEGFVYDTEPASRAVVTMGGIDPALIFPLFKAIQSAFYAEGRDVTQARRAGRSGGGARRRGRRVPAARSTATQPAPEPRRISGRRARPACAVSPR